MKKYLLIITTFAVIGATVMGAAQDVLAEVTETSTYQYDLLHLPEGLELFLHIALILVALGGAVYGVKLAALTQGGMLEKVWNLVTWGLAILAGAGVYAFLSEIGLIHIGGFDLLFQVLLATLFLSTLWKMKKELLRQTLGK